MNKRFAQFCIFRSANVFDSEIENSTTSTSMAKLHAIVTSFDCVDAICRWRRTTAISKLYTYTKWIRISTVFQTDTDVHETHSMPSGTFSSILFIYVRLIYSHETNGEIKIASFLSNRIGFKYKKKWNSTKAILARWRDDRWNEEKRKALQRDGNLSDNIKQHRRKLLRSWCWRWRVYIDSMIKLFE